MLRYENLSKSFGLKKFVSAAAVADYGDAQALWLPPGTPFAYGIAVGACSLTNRSGAAAKLGLAGRYPIGVWTAGQVSAAGALTVDTEDAQDAGTGDFVLHTPADSGSGFLVSADLPFNILGIVQSAAGDQTTPVKIVEVWTGAAWTEITTSLLITDTLIGGGTGEKVLCWPVPPDWVVGGSGTSVPATKYNLRVRHTHSGAGSETPAASQLFVGFAKMQSISSANEQTVALIRENEYIFPRQCDALFPVCSTASRANTVEADVRPI